MGAILALLGTAIPFGGVIIAGVAAVGAGFYVSERVEISGLNKEVAALHQSIDGPSGYIQQIGAINSNLAVVKANNAEMGKNIDKLNSMIDAISAASTAAVARTKTLQAALVTANTKAAGLAAFLAAQRPQGMWDDKTGAVLVGLVKEKVQ